MAKPRVSFGSTTDDKCGNATDELSRESTSIPFDLIVYPSHHNDMMARLSHSIRADLRAALTEQRVEFRRTLDVWAKRQNKLASRMEQMLPQKARTGSVDVVDREAISASKEPTKHTGQVRPLVGDRSTPHVDDGSDNGFEACASSSPRRSMQSLHGFSLIDPETAKSVHILEFEGEVASDQCEDVSADRGSLISMKEPVVAFNFGEQHNRNSEFSESNNEEERVLRLKQLRKMKSRDHFTLGQEQIRRFSKCTTNTEASAATTVATVAKTFTQEEARKKHRTEKLSRFHRGVEQTHVMSRALTGNPHVRWLKTFLRRVVHHRRFDLLATIVIISNALFIGVQVEYMATRRTDKNPKSFLVIQGVYVFIFSMELLLRIVADGTRFFVGSDWTWNLGDVFVVIASIAEILLEVASTASVVRLVRIVRIARIMRVLRTVRVVRSLRILVNSIFSTLKQLVWTLVLLMIILYMFGIIFTQASTDHMLEWDAEPAETICSDNEPGSESCRISLLYKYFGTLPRTIYSLFKTICGGVDWEDVVDPLSDIHWVFVLLFVVFVAFMVFAVLNVVIGTFCNSAIENAHNDEEAVIAEHMAHKERYVGQFRKLFENLESFKYGLITLEDLEVVIKDKQMNAWFTALELNVTDAWTLFKLLDTNEKNVIGVDDFVEGCLRLKGSARSIDLARMMYENRWIMNKLVYLSQDIEKGFKSSFMGQDALAKYLNQLGATLGMEHCVDLKRNSIHFSFNRHSHVPSAVSTGDGLPLS